MLVALGCILPALTARAEPAVEIDIPGMPLREALQLLERQTQVDYYLPIRPGLEQLYTRPVQGIYSLTTLLEKMLAGTGLRFTVMADDLVLIEAPDIGEKPAPSAGPTPALPVVLVLGSESMNHDIRRTPDDSVPYVVIDSATIAASSSQSLEDLFGRFLPIVATEGKRRADPLIGLTGQINLHGLGTADTLVLIDGRRSAATFLGGTPLQPDIASIPAAAIERIEVLPMSASARYGGGSAGGVVNIVLKTECAPTRLQLTLGNTVENGSDLRRAFLSHCEQFPNDRTRLQVSASYSDEAPLLTSERGFLASGRDAIGEHNPWPFSDELPLGAQTNIRSADGEGLWGPDTPNITSVPAGYTPDQGTEPLRTNAGRYNLSLADSAQPKGGRHYALRNGRVTHFLIGTLRHEFSSTVSGDISGLHTQSKVRSGVVNAADGAGIDRVFLRAGTPTNPFDRDIYVAVPLKAADGSLRSSIRSSQLNGGVSVELLRDWGLRMEWSMSQAALKLERPVLRSIATAIATGEINVFQDLEQRPVDLSPYWQSLQIEPVQSTSRISSLWLGGPLLTAGHRTIDALAQFEHRAERFHGGSTFLRDQRLISEARAGSDEERSTHSFSGELRIPLVASRVEQDETPLELLVSTRVDQYASRATAQSLEDSDSAYHSALRRSGSAISSMFALLYRAAPGLLFRASTGEGFLPPSAEQLADPATLELTTSALQDPRRGGEPIGAMRIILGGNSDLKPESSRSLSAGLVLQPRSIPELRLSVDYTHISKHDAIISPAEIFFSDPARFEDLFPQRVVRAPATADGTFSHGQISAVDVSAINSARIEVSSWDIGMHVGRLRTGWGEVNFAARATLQPDFTIRTASLSDPINEAGVTSESPLKAAAIGNISLTRGRWRAGWNLQYFHSYQVSRDPSVIRNQGARRVPHQIYHDAYFHYGLRGDDAALSLSVQNVLNTRPLFDAADPSYYSAFGDPRLATWTLSFSTQF